MFLSVHRVHRPRGSIDARHVVCSLGFLGGVCLEGWKKLECRVLLWLFCVQATPQAVAIARGQWPR